MVINVSVTGAAAEATREEESLWDTRKGGRTTFAWSSATERTTGETKSVEKFDRTTRSHADTSSSRETQGSMKTKAFVTEEERVERTEMRGTLPTWRENDTGKVKISSVSSKSIEDDAGRKINLSAGETFIQSTSRRPSFDKNVLFTRNFDNVSQRRVFLAVYLCLASIFFDRRDDGGGYGDSSTVCSLKNGERRNLERNEI